nr:hypothetical protein [Anaerolineae bacterium]
MKHGTGSRSNLRQARGWLGVLPVDGRMNAEQKGSAMDQQANELAELEIKRSRIMAELETVQTAGESVKREMTAYPEKQDALNARFIDRLALDDIPEADRQRLYRDWNESFRDSVATYSRLAAERERLYVQETVLVRMLVELDHRIEVLKDQLSGQS